MTVSLPGEARRHVDSVLAATDRSLPSPQALFEVYRALPTYRDAFVDPSRTAVRLRAWEAWSAALLDNCLILKMLRLAKAEVRAIRDSHAEQGREGRRRIESQGH
jgi:hypothetical protein